MGAAAKQRSLVKGTGLERRLHRQWFEHGVMADLLGEGFGRQECAISLSRSTQFYGTDELEG